MHTEWLKVDMPQLVLYFMDYFELAAILIINEYVRILSTCIERERERERESGDVTNNLTGQR